MCLRCVITSGGRAGAGDINVVGDEYFRENSWRMMLSQTVVSEMVCSSPSKPKIGIQNT